LQAAVKLGAEPLQRRFGDGFDIDLGAAVAPAELGFAGAEGGPAVTFTSLTGPICLSAAAIAAAWSGATARRSSGHWPRRTIVCAVSATRAAKPARASRGSRVSAAAPSAAAASPMQRARRPACSEATTSTVSAMRAKQASRSASRSISGSGGASGGSASNPAGADGPSAGAVSADRSWAAPNCSNTTRLVIRWLPVTGDQVGGGEIGGGEPLAQH